MMNPPNCPQHRDLLRELALGRLDDRAAAEADAIRHDCEHCHTWWAETFSGPQADTVDRAVNEALAAITLPARRRRQAPGQVWMAVAAAAVMVVAASAMWSQHQSTSPTGPAVATFEPASIAPAAELERLDFESGPTAAEAALRIDDTLITASFEDGDLGDTAVNSGPQVLTTLDFESGSFGELVPKT